MITTPTNLSPVVPAVPVQDRSISIPFSQAYAPAGTTYTCALNGGTPAPCASPWTYTGLATGDYSLVVTAQEPGITRTSASRSFAVDVTAPTATVRALPAVTLASSVSISATTASSGAAGVASYDLRYRRAPWNGTFGALTYPASWAGRTSPVSPGLSRGYEYCVSTRARDRVGNTSAWSAERCTSRPMDDRSLTRSAGWTSVSGSQFYLGRSPVPALRERSSRGRACRHGSSSWWRRPAARAGAQTSISAPGSCRRSR